MRLLTGKRERKGVSQPHKLTEKGPCDERFIAQKGPDP